MTTKQQKMTACVNRGWEKITSDSAGKDLFTGMGVIFPEVTVPTGITSGWHLKMGSSVPKSKKSSSGTEQGQAVRSVIARKQLASDRVANRPKCELFLPLRAPSVPLADVSPDSREAVLWNRVGEGNARKRKITGNGLRKSCSGCASASWPEVCSGSSET